VISSTKYFSAMSNKLSELSEKTCAVCGRKLLPQEIRINELSRKSIAKRIRYLCAQCRKREYDQYVKAMKELIEKNG